LSQPLRFSQNLTYGVSWIDAGQAGIEPLELRSESLVIDSKGV
jgi:hypothetical protein